MGIRGITQNVYHGIVYQYLWAMPPETHPEVWAWLDGSGDDWIPFRFVVTEGAKGEPVAFTDWAKVTQLDRDRMKEGRNKIQELATRGATDIVLPGGATHNVRLFHGKPVRYGDTQFQIDLLSPAVGKDPTRKLANLCWVLQGRTRGGASRQLRLVSPWMSPGFAHTVKVSGDGGFTIPFADSRTAPEFWRWLEAPGDFWLPVRILLERPEGGSQEITEVIRVDDELRAEVRRMRGADR
jgi:hypothetical protein